LASNFSTLLCQKFSSKSSTLFTFGRSNFTLTKQNQLFMKHSLIICCLVLALMTLQQQSFAQPKQGLTLRYLWYNYDNPEPDWDNWSDIFDKSGNGFEIAWNRRLDKGHTWLVIPAKFGNTNVEGSSGDDRPQEAVVNLDALIQYNLFKQGGFITPTLGLGIGGSWFSRTSTYDFNIPASIGLNIRLAKDIYLNGQSQYRFSLNDRPGWHHGVGLVFYFAYSDRDGDGVYDEDDKCPDVAGVVALMGCPDRDGDGVTDAEDQCPDAPGLATLAGCPDRDNDGIPDKDDRCPSEAGTAANSGCPDRDNDGIVDVDDACPEKAGLAAFKGCPDTDSDGIPDKDDKCPTLAGAAATQGCPDRDRDGILDADDACPDQAGPATFRGCPDRDNDGVPDKDDRCPDKAGTVANRGCPEVTAEAKATLERAVRLVQFQTGKATLLASSYAVLNDVADLMNKYPEYHMTISGHTDNTGGEEANQDLSERRAKACYEYLVSKGVNAARMKYAGYGESKPKASNATKAGREQNRRVEFELSVE
jgi:outer membrane protein OmpA-like peptidoglycan-associated protein